jgi:hypothetical protein
MTFIDSAGLKYKTVKKDGEYYLLSSHLDNWKKEYYKIEVTGKRNVLVYIKNNKLKKYEELEWLYE